MKCACIQDTSELILQDPSSNPGLNPGSDPSSDPGSNPSSNPGSNPGSDPGSDPGSKFRYPQVFLDFFYRTALITVVFFNCHVFVEKKIRHVSVLNFIDG